MFKNVVTKYYMVFSKKEDILDESTYDTEWGQEPVRKLDENESGQMVFIKLKLAILMHIYAKQCDLDLGDGQFSERCNVDGSFFNSDAIPIIFGKA